MACFVTFLTETISITAVALATVLMLVTGALCTKTLSSDQGYSKLLEKAPRASEKLTFLQQVPCTKILFGLGVSTVNSLKKHPGFQKINFLVEGSLCSVYQDTLFGPGV